MEGSGAGTSQWPAAVIDLSGIGKILAIDYLSLTLSDTWGGNTWPTGI